MAHIVINDIAGTSVVKPTHFLKAPTARELRSLIYESGACVVGSRFKLLQGHSVLQNDAHIQGGSFALPVQITLVVLPSAGLSTDAHPLTILGDDDDRPSITVIDIRTGEAIVVSFHYFLQHGGSVCLGVLATELAPIIGADVAELARQASAECIFEGEDVLDTWPSAAPQGGQLWQVVGGMEQGGILVREGRDLNSPRLGDRLATGAIIEELELVGTRLRYCLRTGRGPRLGWASVRLSKNELLVRVHTDVVPHSKNLAIQTGETFRAIIQLTDISAIYRVCATAWHDQNSKMALVESVLAQLSAMELPEHDAASNALQIAMRRIASWWQTGV